MLATQKVRNVLRGLLQRYGTEKIKRQLWNYEYAEGRWSCLDTMSGDFAYVHVEKHAKGGNILDLGCGPGAVGNELNAAAYHSYTGVDICDVAIEKARSRTVENRRTDKNNYIQSDIFSYVATQQYDVILLGDSIYYFSHKRIAEILYRYSKYLKQDGVLIVRSWILKDRHRAIIQNIENTCEIVEKELYHQSQIVVITFRLPASRREALTMGRHS